MGRQEDPEVHCHLWLLSKFKDSLSYIGPYLIIILKHTYLCNIVWCLLFSSSFHPTSWTLLYTHSGNSCNSVEDVFVSHILRARAFSGKHKMRTEQALKLKGFIWRSGPENFLTSPQDLWVREKKCQGFYPSLAGIAQEEVCKPGSIQMC